MKDQALHLTRLQPAVRAVKLMLHQFYRDDGLVVEIPHVDAHSDSHVGADVSKRLEVLLQIDQMISVPRPEINDVYLINVLLDRRVELMRVPDDRQIEFLAAAFRGSRIKLLLNVSDLPGRQCGGSDDDRFPRFVPWAHNRFGGEFAAAP